MGGNHQENHEIKTPTKIKIFTKVYIVGNFQGYCLENAIFTYSDSLLVDLQIYLSMRNNPKIFLSYMVCRGVLI